MPSPSSPGPLRTPRIRVAHADLSDRDDARATIDLLDAYARDPMGIGRPLTASVRRRIIPGLRRHQALVLLARSASVPAGVAVCFIRYSTFSARPFLNIHDLIVAPLQRRRGVGSALLAAAERHARRHRCCRITLEVRTDNPAAQALYRRFGIRPGSPPYEYWGKEL